MKIEAVLGIKAPQAKNFRVFLGVKSAAGEIFLVVLRVKRRRRKFLGLGKK